MLNRYRRTLLAVLAGGTLGVLAVTGVQAQEAPNAGATKASAADRLKARFEAADTNHDGVLTKAEMESDASMKSYAKRFDTIDKNHDGKVTPEELQDFVLDAAKVGKAPAN